MARRSGEKTGWHPRTAGMVICAFFAMGAMAGFSTAGHAIIMRANDSLAGLTGSIADTLGPARASLEGGSTSVAGWLDRSTFFKDAIQQVTHRVTVPEMDQSGPPIAIVKRGDDFYSLTDNGALRGPIALREQGDLPIVSGVADDATGNDLLEDAAVLVRAETTLAQLISEMRVNNDGTATLCLERARTELTIDLNDVPHELDRAQQVMKRLDGQQQLVAALDLTTPGEAVVRLRGATVGVKKATPKVTASLSRTRPKVRRQ
ncbi:MAG TPA: cell division protein FtsQ/DivIB [Candidatus Binataceae bacterium]|nr:cell division protein FtsQ/DivIB [Candidatus Binataceae bacterium]